MKKFTLFLAMAAVALAVSCSKDEGYDEFSKEPVTISLATSGFDVSYTPLAVSRATSGDLLAVQIYKTEDGTESPYANGLFEDWSTLSFEGFTNTKYRVVATWVADATTEIYNDGGTYGLPFSAAIVDEVSYDSTTNNLTKLSSGKAKLTGGSEYDIPTLDRYYGDKTMTVTSSNKTITVPMKRMSFGVEITGLTGSATLQITGAPVVTLSTGDMQLFSLSNLATAYVTGNYYEAFDATIEVSLETIFDRNVGFYRNMLATFEYSNGAIAFDFETPFEGEVRVLTFEDLDYRAGLNYLGEQSWSSLIDYESWGTLIYSDTQYTWTDSNNTGLSSCVNADLWGYYGYAFWSGGIAVSNYYKAVASGVDSANQLSVPCGGTGTAGADSSVNFAVVTGDTSLSFGEGVERVINSMYIANTSYMLSSCVYGDSYVVGGLGATDDVWVTVTGYDKEGNEGNTLTYDLATDGVEVEGWNEWDLSTLGAVNKIEFSFDSTVWSDNGDGYDSSVVPAYVAIDNIAVQF